MITLKTLPEATAQEVFDQVARHLLTQFARSADALGYCKYRGEFGHKCAAGCLIADDEYNFLLETSWDRLVVCGVAPGTHRSLIARLQRIHDIDDVHVWESSLRLTAKEYSLSSEVLKEFADEPS